MSEQTHEHFVEHQLLEIRNLLMDIRDRLPPPGTFVEVPSLSEADVCGSCGRTVAQVQRCTCRNTQAEVPGGGVWTDRAGCPIHDPKLRAK